MLIFSKLQNAQAVFFHQTPEICIALKNNSDYGLLCLIGDDCEVGERNDRIN